MSYLCFILYILELSKVLKPTEVLIYVFVHGLIYISKVCMRMCNTVLVYVGSSVSSEIPSNQPLRSL